MLLLGAQRPVGRAMLHCCNQAFRGPWKAALASLFLFLSAACLADEMKRRRPPMPRSTRSHIGRESAVPTGRLYQALGYQGSQRRRRVNLYVLAMAQNPGMQ